MTAPALAEVIPVFFDAAIVASLAQAVQVQEALLAAPAAPANADGARLVGGGAPQPAQCFCGTWCRPRASPASAGSFGPCAGTAEP